MDPKLGPARDLSSSRSGRLVDAGTGIALGAAYCAGVGLHPRGSPGAGRQQLLDRLSLPLQPLQWPGLRRQKASAWTPGTRSLPRRPGANQPIAGIPAEMHTERSSGWAMHAGSGPA